MNDFMDKIDKKVAEFNALSDSDKIWKLTNDLLMCQCDKLDLMVKVNQLEREIELKDKEIADVKLKYEQRDIQIIDEVIQTIYETNIDFYNKLVYAVKFGEEKINIENN